MKLPRRRQERRPRKEADNITSKKIGLINVTSNILSEKCELKTPRTVPVEISARWSFQGRSTGGLTPDTVNSDPRLTRRTVFRTSGETSACGVSRLARV